MKERFKKFYKKNEKVILTAVTGSAIGLSIGILYAMRVESGGEIIDIRFFNNGDDPYILITQRNGDEVEARPRDGRSLNMTCNEDN